MRRSSRRPARGRLRSLSLSLRLMSPLLHFRSPSLCFQINSWDRMPFLTDIATGGVGPATYAAALSETSHSMIIANYGASQGFDNDDGSSWYDTHDNFFYDADGFKMDYGGHDSKFHHNVVIAVHGQNCVGTASFIAGHATSLYENDCVVYGTERVDDLQFLEVIGIDV